LVQNKFGVTAGIRELVSINQESLRLLREGLKRPKCEVPPLVTARMKVDQ